MAAYTLTWAVAATSVGGEDRLKRFALGDTASVHPKFDAALEKATAYIDGYLWPLDDATVALDPMLGHYVALICHFLTEYFESRAESIDKAKKAVDDYFAAVKAGTASLPDADTATDTGAVPALFVSSTAPTRRFDFDDPFSEGSRLMPSLIGDSTRGR